MATISPTPKLQFFDANGNPLSYGFLYTYSAGTTIPVVTYTTAAQTTSNTNPIVLDARGEANVWLVAGFAYKFTLLNSSSVLQYTVDNITAAGTMSTQNASSVAITGGTITGVTINGPFTGNLTGNVTGNVTGNLTGNVTGGSVVATSYNDGQLAGMRNKIINGAVLVNQRRGLDVTANVFNSTLTLDTSLRCPDRWSFIANTSAVVAVSQANDGPAAALNLPYSYKFAVTTADSAAESDQYLSAVQVIEGYEIKSLVNKTFTLSFWVKSSVTGTYSIALWNAIGGGPQTRSYVAEYTISLANTWEYKTITVLNGLPTDGSWNYDNLAGVSVGWNLYCGSLYQTSSVNSWLTTQNYFASTAQANAIGTNGNIFALTGMQLELGSVATPFEHRPFATEFQICQRYYEKSFSYGTPAQQNVGNALGAAYGIATFSGQPFAANVTFAVPKRASPQLTSYAPDAASNNWSTNVTTPTATLVNNNARGFAIRGGTSTTAGNAYSIHWDANAEL